MQDLLMNDYVTDNKVVYVVLGKPIPLQRPRFGDNLVYDPQKSVKKEVINELLKQNKGRPTICGMLHLHADFHMQLPRAKSHKKHLLQQQYHVYKPDLSNLIKFIEDVCVDSRIIEDDCLIASISSRKLYSDNPRTEFYFETLRKETEYEE